MLTGRHMVRDVSCKSCDVKLGWIYEYAVEESQRYKEGRVILERALVTETNGLPAESALTSSASSVVSSDNNN
jgi:protein yippee-like 5